MDAATTRRFAGKVAVVTAAGAGIGRASAIRLADEGAEVVVNALHDDSAQAVVDEILSRGGSARAMALDIGDSAQVAVLVEKTHHDLGRIDVLVNNGGARVDVTDIRTLTDELLREEFRLTFDATVYAIRSVAPHMMAQGSGSIVNTSSYGAYGGSPGGYCLVAYGPAKAAVISLTKVLAVQLGPFGIRVNAVVPATTETPSALAFLDALQQRGGRDAWQAQIPVQRLGRPDEIAAVIAFLASDDASFVTGGEYAADGGLSAQLGSPRLV